MNINEDNIVIKISDFDKNFYLWKPYPPFRISKTKKVENGLEDIYFLFETIGELKLFRDVLNNLIKHLEK